jgi:hypothetical protein
MHGGALLSLFRVAQLFLLMSSGTTYSTLAMCIRVTPFCCRGLSPGLAAPLREGGAGSGY